MVHKGVLFLVLFVAFVGLIEAGTISNKKKAGGRPVDVSSLQWARKKRSADEVNDKKATEGTEVNISGLNWGRRKRAVGDEIRRVIKNKKSSAGFEVKLPIVGRVKRGAKAEIAKNVGKTLFKGVGKLLIKGKDTLISILKGSKPTLSCKGSNCKFCVGKEDTILLCAHVKVDKDENDPGLIFSITANELVLKEFSKIKASKKFLNPPCVDVPVVGKICLKLTRLTVKYDKGLKAGGCAGVFYNDASIFTQCVKYENKKLRLSDEKVGPEDFASGEEDTNWPEFDDAKGVLSKAKLLNIARVKPLTQCSDGECSICHSRNDEEVCTTITADGGEFNVAMVYNQNEIDDFTFSDVVSEPNCHSLEAGKLCLTADEVSSQDNRRKMCFKLRFEDFMIEASCVSVFKGKMSLQERTDDAAIELMTMLQFPSDDKTNVVFGSKLGSLQDFESQGWAFLSQAQTVVKCTDGEPVCNVCVQTNEHSVCSTIEYTGKPDITFYMSFDGYGKPFPAYTQDSHEVAHFCNTIENVGLGCIRVHQVELGKKTKRRGACFDILVGPYVFDRKCFVYNGNKFEDTW